VLLCCCVGYVLAAMRPDTFKRRIGIQRFNTVINIGDLTDQRCIGFLALACHRVYAFTKLDRLIRSCHWSRLYNFGISPFVARNLTLLAPHIAYRRIKLPPQTNSYQPDFPLVGLDFQNHQYSCWSFGVSYTLQGRFYPILIFTTVTVLPSRQRDVVINKIGVSN
jgi:hypothetical protein